MELHAVGVQIREKFSSQTIFSRYLNDPFVVEVVVEWRVGERRWQSRLATTLPNVPLPIAAASLRATFFRLVGGGRTLPGTTSTGVFHGYRVSEICNKIRRQLWEIWRVLLVVISSYDRMVVLSSYCCVAQELTSKRNLDKSSL